MTENISINADLNNVYIYIRRGHVIRKYKNNSRRMGLILRLYNKRFSTFYSSLYVFKYFLFDWKKGEFK